MARTVIRTLALALTDSKEDKELLKGVERVCKARGHRTVTALLRDVLKREIGGLHNG